MGRLVAQWPLRNGELITPPNYSPILVEIVGGLNTYAYPGISSVPNTLFGGNCLNFSGTGYIDTGLRPTPQKITASLWVNWNNLTNSGNTNQHFIFGRREVVGANYDPWCITYRDPSHATTPNTLIIETYYSDWRRRISNPYNFIAGRWYNIVAAWDRLTAESYVYVNGAPLGFQAINYDTGALGGAVNFNRTYIGYSPAYACGVDAKLQELAFLNNILAASEVRDYYRWSTTTTSTELLRVVGYPYPFFRPLPRASIVPEKRLVGGPRGDLVEFIANE